MSTRSLESVAALTVALLAFGAPGAGAYPIAKERELGERFSLEAASQLPFVQEAPVVDFVSRLGARIVSHLDAPQPFDYEFHVVRDATLNAFAVPGGFVYVNSGLIARAANDAELAGVLGHEISHVHAHHVVRQQDQSQLASYASLAGMLLSAIHPAIGAAAMGAGMTAQLKYMREFEQEADFMGARVMRAAGYDPHGMQSFMKRIWDEQRTMPIDEIPPYMLSHPMTEDRITRLDSVLRDVPETRDWRTPSWELERVKAILAAATGDGGEIRSAYEKRSGTGARALALYGLTLLYQGNASGAAAALEKARAEGVPDLDGEIGFAHLRSGDTDAAIRILRGRIETAPDDAVARARLGAALLQKQDYAGARRELEEALKRAPYLADAEQDLGQSSGRSGDQAHGFYHLARAAELRGQIERAITSYDKAVELLPEGSEESERAKQKLEWLHEANTRRIISQAPPVGPGPAAEARPAGLGH